MKTTLNKIKNHNPCKEGWSHLLWYLGKTKADDEPLSILTVLDSNGLDDALWCLRAVDGYDKETRLYAVACARDVEHLMKDPRSLAALDTAQRYVNGEAGLGELMAAWDAAWDAVEDAAGDAVEDAAGDAAGDVTSPAVAAWDAVAAVAAVAATATAVAARSAARDAAMAVTSPAVAARDAARDAARSAIIRRQTQRLREMCEKEEN